MILIGVVIAAIFIELILLARTMIVTKIDCSISVILKFLILIPVLITLMFIELVLYAIGN